MNTLYLAYIISLFLAVLGLGRRVDFSLVVVQGLLTAMAVLC